MTTMDADLSLCVPVYDEALRLPIALERLSTFAQASGLTLEVVVADDGSRDGTADIARQWAAERNSPTMSVRVVAIAHRGKGAAVRAGLREARAPIVGYCDVDLSAGPEEVEALYREIKDGADVAIASRALPESVLEVHQPWLRELGGRCFNAFLRRTTGIQFRDTQCGLKLFRSEVATEIMRYQRLDGFAFDAELVVLAVRLGYDIKELPVRWSHDPASKVSIHRDSLAMSRDILRIVRRLREGKVHSMGIPDPNAMDRMTSGESGPLVVCRQAPAHLPVLAHRLAERPLPRRRLWRRCGADRGRAVRARRSASTCRPRPSTTARAKACPAWREPMPAPCPSSRTRSPSPPPSTCSSTILTPNASSKRSGGC